MPKFLTTSILIIGLCLLAVLPLFGGGPDWQNDNHPVFGSSSGGNLALAQVNQMRRWRGAIPEEAEKALEEIKELVGDPLAKDKSGKPTPIQGRFYASTEYRRELNFAYEANEQWGLAVQNWVRMTQEFVPGGLPALPPVGAANRQGILNRRALYFDLFLEAQRASSEAYKAQDPKKFKGGQEAIDTASNNIAQRLYDLETKNEDFRDRADFKTRLAKIVNSSPTIKTKYDTLNKTLVVK